MGIFTTTDPGNSLTSVKFFIQKDLPESIQANLRETINAENGIVDIKVPIKGYLLVQPGTVECERLKSCWKTPERPERYFVPYTWVDASKEAAKMIPQIFVRDGTPLKIRIHGSIANLNSRETIAARIMHAGGDPTATDDEASVILADPDTEIFNDIVRHYHNDPSKTVESHLWVKKCIDRGIMYHTGNVYKNPGGRRPGDERTAFTEDDETNLCTWIAAVIPFKESGGRTGNKIYQELVARANEKGYEWVGRHTWQSWRERYKKNASRLDLLIAAIVEMGKCGPIGKTPFGYFRITEGKQKVVRKRKRKTENGEEDTVEAAPTQYSVTAPATPSNNMEAAKQVPSTPDDQDWAIKEGHAPTPNWAKRDDVLNSDPSPKRQKTSDGFVQQYAPPAPPPQSATHPIDQILTEIANKYQFLFSEVRSYYDKTRDVEATRKRFNRLRMFIDSMP